MLRTSVFVCIAVVVTATMNLWTSPALAGPLAPPAGPVASSYKTLTDVEPRTLVNATNTPGDATSILKITQPGSYYLGANVAGVSGKNGVVIAAAGVTLDLNGYEVVGVAGSLNGVLLSNAVTLSNTTVFNGTVRNWDVNGVDLVGNFGGVNSRIERVHASACKRYGIRCGPNGLISECTAANIGPDAGFSSFGIIGFTGSVIQNCRVFASTGYGIGSGFYGAVVNCAAEQCGKDGISINSSSLCVNCSSHRNSVYGISTAQDGGIGNGSQIISCAATNNTLAGIQINGQGLVFGCNSSQNGAAASGVGILVQGSGTRIDSNNVAGNRVGISCTGFTGNLIVRNSASSNAGGNYAVPAGNDAGPIGAAATLTSPWGNIAY